MKKNITLFALLLFAAMQGAFAQMTITGKVINAEDKLGMPGVNVLVKGTLRGTPTDNNGNFTLIVPNDAIIVVSFIGFKTVELPVENQTLFEIMLQTDANVLGDIVVSAAARYTPPERAVVTAMGVVRDKISLTTSIQTVSRNELIRSGETNFMMALNGRVAGVNVISDGTITLMQTLRGIKSFNFSGYPLFVIDGMPIMNRAWGGGGASYVDISDIIAIVNIEDIESISVLKGANATVLYGSQAINGAIIITTKKR